LLDYILQTERAHATAKATHEELARQRATKNDQLRHAPGWWTPAFDRRALIASHTPKEPLRPLHLRLLKQWSPTYDRSAYCQHEKREKSNQCTPRQPVSACIRQPGSHPIMDGTDLRPTTRPPHKAPRSHTPGWWTPAYDRCAHHRHKQAKTTRAAKGGVINRGDDRRPPAT